MTFHLQLRTRKHINLKELCYGPNVVIKKEQTRIKREVLPSDYTIDRLIARKYERNEGLLYLVKWTDYPISDCTWEPENHVDCASLENFFTPTISVDRLANAAADFEEAVQQRLNSKNNTIVIRFDLDIFRYCFDSETRCTLNGIEDFVRLPITDCWYYKIDKNGQGVKLSFQLTLIPKIQMKKLYKKENGILVLKKVPIETVRILSATEVCNFEEL